MGEANRRGCYKQRKAEGERKRMERNQQRLQAIANRESSMTPNERKARTNAQQILSVLLGAATGLNNIPYLNDKH